MENALPSEQVRLVDENEKLKEKLDDKTREKGELEKEKVNYVEKIKKLEGRVEEMKEHLGNYIKMMKERTNDFDDLIKYDGLSHIDKCEEQTKNLESKIEKTKTSILEDDKRKLDEFSTKIKESSDITELDKIISELEEFKRVTTNDEIRKNLEAEQLLSDALEKKEQLINSQVKASEQVADKLP